MIVKLLFLEKVNEGIMKSKKPRSQNYWNYRQLVNHLVKIAKEKNSSQQLL